MHVRISSQGPSPRWRGVIVVALLLSFSSICTRAQEQDDVAAAARQERARKAAQQPNAPHVYTDEDLKHDKILRPEDQARVAARKKLKNATPAQQEAVIVPEPPALDGTEITESLGEIARRYRQEKQAREAAKAEGHKPFVPFPYTVAHPALAAPKPGLNPLVAPPNEARSGTSLRSPSSALPRMELPKPSGRRRISPFEPRPLLAIPPSHPAAPVNPVPMARDKRTSRSVTGAPAEMAGVPPSIAVRSVEVQRGDSWWKLARRHLGSGARWTELRSLNPAMAGAADSLKRGATVVVPTDVSSMRPVPSNPSTQIRVNKGDTLWGLAREHLGRASAWTCLAKMNPEVTDYTRLKIGLVLHLPTQDLLGSCESRERRP